MWTLLIASFVLLMAGLAATLASQTLFDAQLDHNTALQQQMLMQASFLLVMIGFVLLVAAVSAIVWNYWSAKRRKANLSRAQVESSVAKSSAAFPFGRDEFDQNRKGGSRGSRLLSESVELP